jgi:SAM-dependent methyltransferase
MTGFIRWDVLAELAAPRTQPGREVWDRFATRYDGYAHLESEFTRHQIDSMRLAPDETVLDIGAGPGRIAVPAARLARRVTALDASKPMLAVLEQNARVAGVDNLRPLHLAWEDAVVGENLERHDVVVASRSPGMRDLKKLDAVAIKRAYVMLFAGISLKGFHDELLEGIQDPPPRPPLHRLLSPAALVFNQLCDMGIDASVTYVPDGFTKWYPSREAAYADLAWLGVPPEHAERLRRNLEPHLREEDGGVRLLRETKTVIVWWSK